MTISINTSSSESTIQQVRDIISTCSNLYPNIIEWYNNVVIPSLSNDTGLIITAVENTTNKIVGVVILKNTSDEKKIRHISVLPEYRCCGIGSKMISKAFEILGSSDIVITVSEDSMITMKYILEKFEFELVEEIPGMYLEGKSEFIYVRKE